jgi:hypothetical protein
VKYKQGSIYNSIPKAKTGKKVANANNPNIDWGSGTVSYSKVPAKKLVTNNQQKQPTNTKVPKSISKKVVDPTSANINWESGKVKYDKKPIKEILESTADKFVPREQSALEQNLLENLYPFNYDDPVHGSVYNRGFKAGILGQKESKKEAFDQDIENARKQGYVNRNTARFDAQSYFMGRPQEFNTFKQATYRPGKKNDDNAQVFELSDPTILQYLKEMSEYPELFQNGRFLDNDKSIPGAGIMANYTISKGKDDRGEYISYYDKWDLAHGSNAAGKPYDIYGRYYINDPEVKSNPKIKKLAKQRRDEIIKERGVTNFSKGGSIPNAQFGDLLSTGPLADLFKSGEEWNKAWRGDIFAKNGLLNKTIYQNQPGYDRDKYYGDPNSPFYDPNYTKNIETAKEESQADYDSQYQSYMDEKARAAQEGRPFDETPWQDISGGPGTYVDTVMAGNANIQQYKMPSDAQKLQSTAQGVFSGLQYQGAYQPKEPVKLEQGFQGTQWAQYGKNISNNNINMRELTINDLNRYYYGGHMPYAQYGEYMQGNRIDPASIPQDAQSDTMFGADDQMERDRRVDRIYSNNQQGPVQKRTQDPMGVIQNLRGLGYLKGFSDEQIMKMDPRDQDALFQAEMKYFNENDPRSTAKRLPGANVVQEITTPLTASVREIIPGEPTPPSVDPRAEFLEWYSKQPENTIQEYQGRKIKIDRSSGKSDRGGRGRYWEERTPGGPPSPDKVIIRSGLAKDIYNRRYGGDSNGYYYYQTGGPVNYSGYTPGSETSMNPMNIIPGQSVTMNPQGNYPVTEPLLAIAKFGKKKIR